MTAYPAMLDVPRELIRYVARLLRAERKARGTRTGTRSLTCWFQALFVIAWFRDKPNITRHGNAFGLSPATAYRYLHEGIDALAAQAPDLHDALQHQRAVPPRPGRKGLRHRPPAPHNPQRQR